MLVLPLNGDVTWMLEQPGLDEWEQRSATGSGVGQDCQEVSVLSLSKASLDMDDLYSLTIMPNR